MRYNKIQAELDFVDIELNGDTPLYVDPFALSIRKDDWSMRCTRHIVSFFQSALSAIHRDDEQLAHSILSNLAEPNETRLGKSEGQPRGRGVSGKQRLDLYEALADSEAAKTGVLSEIAEFNLFIEGIGPDKISDITTNIIRGLLIEYTQSQCLLHGIATVEFRPEVSGTTLIAGHRSMPSYRSGMEPRYCSSRKQLSGSG